MPKSPKFYFCQNTNSSISITTEVVDLESVGETQRLGNRLLGQVGDRVWWRLCDNFVEKTEMVPYFFWRGDVKGRVLKRWNLQESVLFLLFYFTVICSPRSLFKIRTSRLDGPPMLAGSFHSSYFFWNRCRPVLSLVNGSHLKVPHLYQFWAVKKRNANSWRMV